MKIDFLEMESFKGINHQSIELNGKSTIFFGVNGVGKSSILEAINILFAPIINKISANRFKQVDSLDIDDVKFGESKTTISMKFHFLDSKNDIYEHKYFRTIERRSRKKTHHIGLETICNEFKKAYLDDEFQLGENVSKNQLLNMPIYANYGPHRAVHVVPIQRIRNRHTFDKISAFEKAIVNVIDFRMFFEWFRDQQEYENHIKLNENCNYVDKQLSSVKKAVLSILDKFTDIKIMFNPLRMVATKENENIKIEQLSDGEKCTLAMIGDLARRLALANPSLDNPLEGEGIVLIDEIELHLHPTWQAMIVPRLVKIFPNIQFIITTHSPKILGEVSGDINIFKLEKTEKDIEISQNQSLVGRDSNYILEKYMGTSSLNLETKGKISRMYTLIKDRKYDEAKELIDQLEKLTDGTNPDVISAKMLIARGKAKV